MRKTMMTKAYDNTAQNKKPMHETMMTKAYGNLAQNKKKRCAKL